MSRPTPDPDSAGATTTLAAADPETAADAATREGREEQQSILSSSAVMAAGTIVSRMSGFVRTALLAAALGLSLHADVFNIANTIPNMLYILLAGGVFNAVLVPQLVRAMRHDDDGGEAYTNRVITLAALFLGAVTIVLVVFAPTVMSLYLADGFDAPDRAAQLDSVIAFARYCLPQVFFYGMFVLVGQILNARGRFGPMMWAPIANNVIAMAVLVVYLIAFGPARGAELTGGFSDGQELLLGLGSTLGIAAQLVILVPYLRKAGFTFRPRFDFRGAGLGHTARLGTWTVLFVVVNQIAYTVVVRLASGGTVDDPDGTGYSVYAATFLIVMVPHSIVTVSLATAILPRLSQLAAAGDLAGLGRSLSSTLRTSLAVVVPFAALLPIIASDLGQVVWGYGGSSDFYRTTVPSLSLFGPGLIAFTVHYLVLRGFYALELTRTVFFVQCAVAGTNVVAALVLVGLTGPAATSPALVLAYFSSYAVGAVVSYNVLSRRLRGAGTGGPGGGGRRRAGGPPAPATGPVVPEAEAIPGDLATAQTLRYALRLAVAVAGATGLAGLVAVLGHRLLDRPGLLTGLLILVVVSVVDVVAYLVLARLMRLDEVTSVLRTVTGRLSRRRARHRAPTMIEHALTTPGADASPVPGPTDEEPEEAQVQQHASRPGDVLAGRYRLVDLLNESGEGRFWRAYDRILERHVAVHVIAAADDRAVDLMDAARRSATVLDARLLRVLDADSTSEVCYVVNEWGWGTSLDTLVTGTGPLGPRRAAWVISEVAEAVAAAHAVGVAHGRLAPENVLIDRTGRVRLTGLCVDAALRGLTVEDTDSDLIDLVGLLYCSLTTKWPGASLSAVPDAPTDHGTALRPRRVRAGVPRALDTLCDDLLHPHARGRRRTGVTTAKEIADYLSDFVGDPSGIPDALRAGMPPVPADDELVVLPPVPEMTVREANAAAAFSLEDTLAPRRTDPTPTSTFEAMARVAGNASDEVPTEAGIPIFGEDDDVSWLEKRRTPAAPPPPFEEPPERPLFAPTPPEGVPERVPRPGTAAARPADRTDRVGSSARQRDQDRSHRAGSEGYWPFEADGGGRRRSSGARPLPGDLQVIEQEVPGRNSFRIGVALGVVLLLGLLAAVAFNVGRGRNPLGGSPDRDNPPSAQTASPSAPTSQAPVARIGGIGASNFDPESEDGLENPEDAPAAVDGDPDTAWSTVTYLQQLGPGGLKSGVGLVLDLRSSIEISTVNLQLDGAPTDISLYVADEPPSSLTGLEAVASATDSGSGVQLDPQVGGAPATGRYLVVWLTSLPEVSDGFRGEIAEVVVRGR